MKPVKDPIEKIRTRRTLEFIQDTGSTATLKAVQKILEKKKTHDIVFIIGNERIPAHKEVLSLRSSYFANMFSSIIRDFFSEF